MEAQASDFQGMISTVLQSQSNEVILGKQPVLSDYGREVRASLSALPPEVTNALMNEYRTPTPQLMDSMAAAIIQRELGIENVEQGVGLDQEWLKGAGAGRSMSESSVGNDDPWNLSADQVKEAADKGRDVWDLSPDGP